MPVQISVARGDTTPEYRTALASSILLSPGGSSTSQQFIVGFEPLWIQCYGLEGGDEIIVQMVGGDPAAPVVEQWKPAGGRQFVFSEHFNSGAIFYPGRYRLLRSGAAAATVYAFPCPISQNPASYYATAGEAVETAEMPTIILEGTAAPLASSVATPASFTSVLKDDSGSIGSPPFATYVNPWTVTGNIGQIAVRFTVQLDLSAIIVADAPPFLLEVALIKNGVSNILIWHLDMTNFESASGNQPALQGMTTNLTAGDTVGLRLTLNGAACVVDGLFLTAERIG